MGFPRRCGYGLQLILVDFSPNADGEDANPGLFGHVCFRNCRRSLFVGFAVGNQDYHARYDEAGVVTRREHLSARGTQGRCNVSVTASDIQSLYRFNHVVYVVECIQTEADVYSITEQQDPDLHKSNNQTIQII